MNKISITKLIIIGVLILVICATILLIVFRKSIEPVIVATPTPNLYFPAGEHPAFPSNLPYGWIPIQTQDYEEPINENQSEVATLEIQIGQTQEDIDGIIRALQEIEED